MYKALIIFWFLFSLCSFCQDNKQTNLIKFQESFNSLSNVDFEYIVRYDENNETLYFETIKLGKLINGYKILIKDIHPKGIYLFEDSGIYSIRILSINNAHVFIKENFEKKYRYSNTINYVEIGVWSNDYKDLLKLFIHTFEEFLNSKKTEKSESHDNDEIIIIFNKKDNKN